MAMTSAEKQKAYRERKKAEQAVTLPSYLNEACKALESNALFWLSRLKDKSNILVVGYKVPCDPIVVYINGNYIGVIPRVIFDYLKSTNRLPDDVIRKNNSS